jgi:tetratricopeptide (TPR) repeat protein
LIVPAIFGPQIVSVGREFVSRWFTTRAERKSLAGDLPGALQELSRAIYWNPDDLELRYLRALWRTDMNDLSGSLADWNDLISQYKDPEHLPPQRNAWLFDQADVYSGRAWVFVRLGRGREAIDDATQAVKLRPTPRYYNSRAYIRAIAKTELFEGLADVDRAIVEVGQDSREYATFLDTRGYLLHLLDRNDDALKDLNQAIEITDQQKRRLLQQQFRFDMRRLQYELKQMDGDLAVMYHHRGLVQEKLGNPQDARDDLLRGAQLGYDPAKGVL